MIVSIVRFRSRLTDDRVQSAFEERADLYRDIPGLAQKIYLRFRDSGEFGAIYLWDSEEALEQFAETRVAQTIATTYDTVGPARVELADVQLLVDNGAVLASAVGASDRRS